MNCQITCYAIMGGIALASFVLGVIVGRVSKCDKSKCAEKKSSEPKKKGEKPFEKRKPHPAPADGSIEIYVGNLSYDFTDEMLLKEFSAFGKVNSARIVINRYNGKSKGFGFVQMPNRGEAEAAVKALNDKEILGRKLKCNEAKNLI